MQSGPDIFVQAISDNCERARLIMESRASTRHKACPKLEGGQHQSSCYNSDPELYRAVSQPDLTVSLDTAVLYLLKSPRKLNKYLSVLSVNVCQPARIVKLCKCKHKTPLCCQDRVVWLEGTFHNHLVQLFWWMFPLLGHRQSRSFSLHRHAEVSALRLFQNSSFPKLCSKRR